MAKWDADFYVKVDDDVHVNLGEPSVPHPQLLQSYQNTMIVDYLSVIIFLGLSGMLGTTLSRHLSKPRVYIGCMKSGPVLSQK